MPTSAKTTKRPRRKRSSKAAPAPVWRVRITTRRGCLVLRYAIQG